MAQTNTIRCSLALTALGAFCSIAFGAEALDVSLSPDKSTTIAWKCSDDECVISVSEGQLSSTEVWKSTKVPVVTWHSNNLAEVYNSCGAPCNYSVFYSKTNGVSVPYEFVMAVYPQKMMLIQANKGSLDVLRIYGSENKKIASFKLDFSPTAALPNVVEQIYF